MTLVGVILMAVGVAFLLVAAIGLVRLPDPLQRMHSATKAGTLGTTLVILGAMLLGEVARPQTGIPTILFLLVTLPLGAQLLGRAAYLARTPLQGIEQDPLADDEQFGLKKEDNPAVVAERADPRRTGE